MRIHRTAVDKQPAVGADELDPVGVLVFEFFPSKTNDLDVVDIGTFETPIHGGVEQTVLREVAFPFYADRTGMGDAEPPMRDVHVMGAPVGDAAPGVIEDPAPAEGVHPLR